MANWSDLFPKLPPYSSQTTSFTASDAIPSRYAVNCSGGSYTATIPEASTASGVSHLFKVLVGAGANTLTLARSGSDLIDGQTSVVLNEGEAVTLHSDGSSNWWVS